MTKERGSVRRSRRGGLRYALGSRSFQAVCNSSLHRSLSTSCPQSTSSPFTRASRNTLNDPHKAMHLLRKLVQRDIDRQVANVMDNFVVNFFSPAARNAADNLGLSNEKRLRLINEACAMALDQAKANLYPKICTESSFDLSAPKPASVTEFLPNEHREGLQVKDTASSSNDSTSQSVDSEIRVKEEECKVDENKLFLLQSSTVRVLADHLRQTTAVVENLLASCKRYTIEAEDLPLLQTSLLESDVSHGDHLLLKSDVATRLNVRCETLQKLEGFVLPHNFAEKVESSWRQCHCSSDIRVVCHPVKDEFIDNEDDESKIMNESNNDQHSDDHNREADVESSMPGSSDDELAFLQGMNLHSLVREFELQTASASHTDDNYTLVGILAMDSDDESENNNVNNSDLANEQHSNKQA